MQQAHPPILLAAYDPGAMKRAATLGNGWLPADLPHDAAKQMIEGMRGVAQETGRDPDDLAIVVRANLDFTEQERPTDGFLFTDTPGQIKADIEETREYADELHFDPSFSPDGETLGGFPKTMEQMKELAG